MSSIYERVFFCGNSQDKELHQIALFAVRGERAVNLMDRCSYRFRQVAGYWTWYVSDAQALLYHRSRGLYLKLTLAAARKERGAGVSFQLRLVPCLRDIPLWEEPAAVEEVVVTKIDPPVPVYVCVVQFCRPLYTNRVLHESARSFIELSLDLPLSVQPKWSRFI